MRPQLPSGPRQPPIVQMVGWWSRPVAFLERARRRYGKRFTIRLLVAPPFVILTEPDQLKELFAAPPDVLHPGEGAQILEPIVGSNSVILLDDEPHLEQRKLMLPAFHGERMERLEGLMREIAESELAGWPRNEPVTLHPHLQGVTLEIILRAVFGLDAGERLNELRGLLAQVLEFGENPLSMIPPLQRSYFGRGPFVEFMKLRDRVDELIYGLIDERRDEAADRDDILALLLAARREDGTPMRDVEIRDELMTALVAGHETTASELAWAFERISREPHVQARLIEEIDAANGDEYLTATVQETLRRRPVLPNAEPRLVKKPVEIGGWKYPEGVCLIANAYLLHHDPDVYPDPYAFRPERFLDNPPGTFTWIPFGGGRRRCLGASFATLEMKIVLRSVLERATIEPGSNGLEMNRRRAITVSPGKGARTVLRERAVAGNGRPSRAVSAAAVAGAVAAG